MGLSTLTIFIYFLYSSEYFFFQDNIILTSVCLPELSYFPSTYCQGQQVKISNHDELEIVCDKLVNALDNQNTSQVLNVLLLINILVVF